MYGGMAALSPTYVSSKVLYEAMRMAARLITQRRKPEEDFKMPVRPFPDPGSERAAIIAWAFQNGRLDILAMYGIFLPPDFFEP